MKISLGSFSRLGKAILRDQVRSMVYEAAEEAKVYAHQAALTVDQTADQTADRVWRRLDKML